LVPRSVLEWSAEPTKGEATPGINGKSTVTAEGKIDLGPYGHVSVGGLTTQQACDAIAKHLAKYMKSPRVRVNAMIPATEPPREIQPTGHYAPAHGFPQPAPQPPMPTPAGEIQRLAPVPQGKALVPPGPLKRVNFDDPPAKPDENKDKKEPKPDEAPKPDEGTGKVRPFVPQGDDRPHFDPHGPPPTELSKQPLPPYVIEPPDILAVQYPLDTSIPEYPQPVNFQSLVRPDGTISLGVYGDVFVGGMTLDQARLAIGAKLRQRDKDFDFGKLNVDVLQYNSKFYYVITDFAGSGQNVEQLPVTGNETVLDAIARIQLRGLSAVSSKHHIYLARRAPGMGDKSQVLKVDWIGTTKNGGTDTNYQVFPGDRIYICADAFRTANTWVDKVIAPFERIMGFTLLTSQTINSIRTNPNRGGGGFNNNTGF
jgi:protein involved in polysaccharide export with SLBB domain